MAEESKTYYSIPVAIKQFVFELYDAMRLSRRVDEVQRLYEHTFREISEKYFNQSSWPDAETVSAEVENDRTFLIFYKEMTIRHMSTKLKPQLSDNIMSWFNYLQLFDIIMTSAEDEVSLCTQWIHEILNEFVYQFQGFCQYRCQVGNHNPEVLKVLVANKEVWDLPKVLSILHNLIAWSNKNLPLNSKATASSNFKIQFGYFATIELARLECLLGEFTSSIDIISKLNLSDRNELFQMIPNCHFNVFYHAGVSSMLLRKYSDAIDIFSDIILHVNRILKPGSASNLRTGNSSQLQKMLDRALALLAIVITIFPAYRVDDQVREYIETKWGDKLRLMQTTGSRSIFSEVFEGAAPKFISPAVPDYTVPYNSNNDAFHHVVTVFLNEIEQHASFLKLRSYFGLYSAIEITKLSRFNDTSSLDLINQLLSFKHKLSQSRKFGTSINLNVSRNSVLKEVQYYVDDGILIIAQAAKKSDMEKSYERYFITGIRKHSDIVQSLSKAFAAVGI